MSTSLIDLSTLERLFKGDRTRVADWLRLYMEEAPLLFRELIERLEADDAKGLARVAHELRPQAHYLGAPQLLAGLVSLGEKAHFGDAALCRGSVTELLSLGKAVEDEVRTVLNSA